MERSTDPSASRTIAAALDRKLQAVALTQTKAASRDALETMRKQMAAAGLGRLGFALGSGGDKTVHRKSGGGWSASGWVFIRSQSPRTVGAIVSYTEGASILPRRGRWLWFPTDDIARLVGLPLPSTGGGKGKANFRLEPRLWDRTYGRRFGPLFPMSSDDGTPLLVVRNASLALSGAKRSLKPLTKTGKARKGQVAQEIVVAFIGIANTRRAARIDPRALAGQASQRMLARMSPAFQAGAA